ncbi:hypothetical protein I6E52_00120 [Salinibacterium sp. NG253]|uniref:hypothetical protein n=1 Tax=Salinibacterium sp. NG253 TaxID=2792039 RepID=UPI0018CF42F5|nr:hypothetical protein [Salinibacterium sp. NG253]MBH0115247.1 hypothetical protein [Salinibacterium sp. NG253]
MRLSTVAPDLTAEISTLGDVSLRDVSRAAATWVLSQVDIDDVRLAEATTALGERHVNDHIREQLWELVQELDELVWNLEEAESGEEATQGYIRAFARARAANALWYALASPVSSETVAECLYEAQAVTGDVDGLRAVILQPKG